MGVSPFGNLRIKAHLRLPVAYRSLSRPSSAPDAKAFTLCSSSLELPSFRFSLSFELLEFLTNVRDIARERFSLHTFSSLHFHFREIVFYPYWKDLF